MHKDFLIAVCLVSFVFAGQSVGVRLWGNMEITAAKSELDFSCIPVIMIGDSGRHFDIGLSLGYNRSVLRMNDYKTEMTSVLIGAHTLYMRQLYRTRIAAIFWGGEISGRYSLPPKVTESSPSGTFEYREKEYVIGNLGIGIPVELRIFLSRRLGLSLFQPLFQMTGDVVYSGMTPERKVLGKLGIPRYAAPAIQFIYTIR